MALNYVFWGLYLASLIYTAVTAPSFKAWVTGNVVWFVLIGILGYAVLGVAVHK